MKVVTTIAEMQHVRSTFGADTLGFVPTMGYLHAGHLSLVRYSVAENMRSVVSIFVNPTQFGPGEDLARYPRDLERDLALLSPLGLDCVFVPAVNEMYPSAPGPSTVVTVHGPTECLEGSMRPGHFAGVATVVAKLFNIIRPTRAYFGQKDAQQVAVITKMVDDLNFPLRVVVCPTVREADGLAMSSRNVFLTPTDRETAKLISCGLFAAAALWQAGERKAAVLEAAVHESLRQGSFIAIDYVAVVDPLTFDPYTSGSSAALIAVAARVGATRLIDNILLSRAAPV
ncbi:MAG: Pantothenate synthetase [Firmicutes bacterium]|nr:Pantothenate synthetase [Bacillota bacterium]